MIVVHAHFPIADDQVDDAIAMIQDLAEQSRAEEGTIDYRAATDVEDRTIIRFMEQYEDEDAFVAHTQTDHFAEFEEALGDFLAGEPEVYRFDVDSKTELEL